MLNTIWDMPLTPNAKLVGLALKFSGSDAVADIVRLTGLDKATTERAIRLFKKVESENESLPVSTIKIAPRPVSDGINLGLTDLITHFNRLAKQSKVKTHQTRHDYARLRSACKLFGVGQTYDEITCYFQQNHYRKDSMVGILSYLRYLNRTGVRA